MVIQKIHVIKNNQLDFSKIATNANDAANGNFINEDKIHKEYWGDTDSLTYVKMENGTYQIREGSGENAVVLGYTSEINGLNDKINIDVSVDKSETQYYQDGTKKVRRIQLVIPHTMIEKV